MEKKQFVKSPEGVRKLMEDLWNKHHNNQPFPLDNVYWVELPPLTEEEKAQIAAKKKKM